uniref:Uncharacterized protein n=1 Tax=Ditylenchus dipsaci TaxID=166011 RepID=A0A915DGZ9_9BILA
MHSQSPKSARSQLRVSLDALLLRLPPSPSFGRIIASCSSNSKQYNGVQQTSSATLVTPTVLNMSIVCGLFTLEEARLLGRTLKKCLERCDFGAEVVIRLLNDKRSLFKSLLAKCTEEAHDIQIFDVDTLRQQCPRAAHVSDGVTLFFKKVAKGNVQGQWNDALPHEGVVPGRKLVVCKRSVVDTILMTNIKNYTNSQCLSGRCSRLRSCSVDFLDAKKKKREASHGKCLD